MTWTDRVQRAVEFISVNCWGIGEGRDRTRQALIEVLADLPPEELAELSRRVMVLAPRPGRPTFVAPYLLRSDSLGSEKQLAIVYWGASLESHDTEFIRTLIRAEIEAALGVVRGDAAAVRKAAQIFGCGNGPGGQLEQEVEGGRVN